MAYSQAFSQAVTIVVYIAVKMNYKNSNEYLATGYIAEKMNIPLSTANKVIKSLVISGIIQSKEGAKGGLLLAKDPEQITLLDIFTAIEQNRPLFRPIGKFKLKNEEVEAYRIKVNSALNQAEAGMKNELGKVNIKQLIQ